MQHDHTFDAIILLSRGSYGRAPQEQLNAMVAAVRQVSAQAVVLGAMVDQGDVSLPTALQQAASAGARQILVQPVFIPADRNLQRWLAKVIVRWHRQWQGQTLLICMADPLGDHAAISAAVVQAIQTPSVFIRNVLATPPMEWESDPDGWSQLPAHTHHVFFCRGPRCTARGADELAACLSNQIKEHGLLQGVQVLVAQTGCLYPCNHGPLMVVYPDGVWYGNLTEAAIKSIVQDHFLGGKVVEAHMRFSR